MATYAEAAERHWRRAGLKLSRVPNSRDRQFRFGVTDLGASGTGASRFRAGSVVTHRTADATAVVADTVRRAEVDPRHAELDALLK